MAPEDAQVFRHLGIAILSSIVYPVCYGLLYGATIVHLSRTLYITAHFVSGAFALLFSLSTITFLRVYPYTQSIHI